MCFEALLSIIKKLNMKTKEYNTVYLFIKDFIAWILWASLIIGQRGKSVDLSFVDGDVLIFHPLYC